MSQAEQLKAQCASEIPMVEDAINAWMVTSLEQLRQTCGEDAVHSFKSNANTPTVEVSKAGVPERNVRLWVYLNQRAGRLDRRLEAITTA